MSEEMKEGWGRCDRCNEEYYATKVKYPSTDSSHGIPCPKCGATVGWVSKGTDDFNLVSRRDNERQQKEEAAKPDCPKCGRKMVIRNGYSEFWGCSNYPNCNGTREIY